MFKIWIDADACPKMVKEVVFKASFRLKASVCLVANSYMSYPMAPHISFVQVEKGAVAINPRGELYTEDNIGERLSVRDFKQDLMDGGEIVGGPPPLGPKDKAKFTNAFDKITTQLLKG